MAARKRGTVLQFLAQNFSRHMVNTTRYNYKTNVISWRVEWIFPNVDTKPLKFVDEKCLEHNKLSGLLDKYLNPNATPFEGSKTLLFYRSVGFSGVKILLKAEKIRGSANKFFELDPTETLGENLSGKCIVEFPIIFIVLKDHAYNFEIITPEDEFDYKNDDKTEIDDKNSTIDSNKDDHSLENGNSNNENFSQNYQEQRKRPRQLLTEKIAKQKKMAIEKELKEERKRRPKNLLFTTGYSSEESIVSSDTEGENTENK